MNAVGRDVARYPHHIKIGFINTFRYDTWSVWPSLPTRWNRFHNVFKTRVMWATTEIIWFCKFDSGLLLPFRSQTLVNCTWLDSLKCVVYFYNRLKVICATSKHLESADMPGVSMVTLIDLCFQPPSIQTLVLKQCTLYNAYFCCIKEIKAQLQWTVHNAFAHFKSLSCPGSTTIHFIIIKLPATHT